MLLYALEFVSSQLLSGFGYFMLNACNMIAFAIVDNMPLGHNTHLYWLLLLLQRNIQTKTKSRIQYSYFFSIENGHVWKRQQQQGIEWEKKKN